MTPKLLFQRSPKDEISKWVFEVHVSWLKVAKANYATTIREELPGNSIDGNAVSVKRISRLSPSDEISLMSIHKILQRAWNLPNPLALPDFLSRAHAANVASAASQMSNQEAESTLPVEEKSRSIQL